MGSGTNPPYAHQQQRILYTLMHHNSSRASVHIIAEHGFTAQSGKSIRFIHSLQEAYIYSATLHSLCLSRLTNGFESLLCAASRSKPNIAQNATHVVCCRYLVVVAKEVIVIEGVVIYVIKLAGHLRWTGDLLQLRRGNSE